MIDPLVIDQLYDAMAAGPLALFPVELTQTGDDAGVMAGTAGFALTTTLVVPAADWQPFSVTMTEYVPPFAVVAFAIDGFCRVDVKPSGPVHAYVAPVTVGVDSEIVPPSQ